MALTQKEKSTMRKNETGEELDKDEIIALLLSVLENYPKHDIQHLQLLLAHPKTKKIATGLLEGKVHNLSTDDFEGVARLGTFLHICGVYLLWLEIYSYVLILNTLQLSLKNSVNN